MKKFGISLADAKCAKRLMALCMILMLVLSFAGTWIYTSGGKVKMEELFIDQRGGQIAIDLYYPVGASEKDPLPAVVIMPGAGSNKHGTRMICEELARRGIVALNCDGYGQGESEQPPYTESGYGRDGWWQAGNTDIDGMLDCVNFARSLVFVDSTRIGVSGHSWGAWRSNQTILADCGYLTLNDMMINVLYEELGIAVTEEEISQDAAEVAAKYLNEDQMQYFNYRYAEQEEYYNTRVLAACLIGNPGTFARKQEIVSVGGYEVSRSCQANVSWAIGLYDHNTLWWKAEDAIASFYETDGIALNEYYALDDLTGTSTKLGAFFDTSVENSEALSEAIKNREIRVVTPDDVTHTGEIYVPESVSNIVEFFVQVFNYNNGELGAADSNPIDTKNIVGLNRWLICYVMYFVAFLMLLAFFTILIKTTEFFKPLALAEGERAPGRKLPKLWFWIFTVATMLLSALAIYGVGKWRSISFPPNNFWFPICKATQMKFIAFMGTSSLAGFIIMAILNKKFNGNFGFKELVATKPVNVAKSLLASCIGIAFMYLIVEVIRNMFHLNLGFFQSLLPHMKSEQWAWAARYFVLFLPFTFCINLSANCSKSPDLREELDALRAAVINLIPIAALYLIEYIHRVTFADGSYLINFESMYSFFTMIPLSIYMAKRFFDKTGNVWFGTFFLALLLAWGNTGTLEYGSGSYIGQTFISTFFGV